MRYRCGIAALLAAMTSLTANAQAPDRAELERLMEQARQMTPPDPAALQRMQEQALAFQACMGQVDQGALQSLQVEGQKLGQELRALCGAGKRDEAEKRAMAYARKVSDSPTLAKVRACGEQMKGMPMPALDYAERAAGGEAGHVCDSDMP